MLVCACVWRVGVEVGVGVRIGVGYLCPPVRNDIVNPCYTREGEREREKGREKMRVGERKRERMRERDRQATNKQRNTKSAWRKKRSDAGSQYRCGLVGRGGQPSFTPNTPPNPLPYTDTYSKSFQNARFPTFWLMLMDRWMDRRTATKKAINQTKHNHKKFQNLALTTFFPRREPPYW